MLRPYQQQAIEDLRAATAEHRSVLYVLPTGGGKTRISAEIIGSAAQKGHRVMFGVHRIELVKQTSAALSQAGIAHSLVTPDVKPDDAMVHVASVQTLARRLDDYAAPTLYIQDEAHHAVPSNTWGRVIDWLPMTSKIIGVTATPERLDGRGLGGIFQTMVLGPSVQELIDAGYLSKPILYAPPVGVNLDNVHTRAGDYAREEIALEMDKPAITGRAVDHYHALARGLQTLVFCTSVAHAENVALAFQSAGVAAVSIDGSLSDKERSERILGFASGKYRVLTSCDLIGEGFDLDLLAGGAVPIGCVMVLRPTKSLSLWLQMLGRGLRPHADKSHTVIIDAVGNWKELGLPQTPREWSLTAGKRKRSKVDDVSIKQCPQCYGVDVPTVVCVQCGFVFPVVARKMIETVEGELVAIDTEMARIEIERRRRMARTLQELIELERIAGHKRGWAEHVWRGKLAKRGTVETFTA